MKNDDKKIIGTNIRHLRTQKKITQGELARVTGIVLQQISKYERGETAPGSTNLLKLAQALGVTTAELTGEGPLQVNEPGVDYQTAHLPLSTVRRHAIEILEKMSDEELEKFVAEQLARKHHKGG